MRRIAAFVRPLMGVLTMTSLTMIATWGVVGLYLLTMLAFPDFLTWCVALMEREREWKPLIEITPAGAFLGMMWLCGVIVWTWDRAMVRVWHWGKRQVK